TGPGPDLRPRHPPLARRAHHLAEHRRRLRTLQPEEGRAHAATGGNAPSAPRRASAELVGAAGSRSAFPAPLPASELAGLPLLGHRAGTLGDLARQARPASTATALRSN